jgi:hypothetical protein
MGFLFKWFASSTLLYILTSDFWLSALGGLAVSAVDSLFFGHSHEVVRVG